MRQIFDSYVFTRIKRRFPDNESFEDWLQKKVVLISGDLTVENLGLSNEDEDRVVRDTHMIINSAASVKFDDHLRKALQINYFGPQRILNLAKKCKHLEVFIHVSTAYVNSNRIGNIEEMIYFDDQDATKIVDDLWAQSDEFLSRQEKQILGTLPNTYTFTKNLAEKALSINQGDVKVSIVRPTIIASAHVDPFPGWTDTISAAGGLLTLCGIGIKHVLPFNSEVALDIVPVDYVINTILLAACETAIKPLSPVEIYTAASSDLNPLKLDKLLEYGKRIYDKIELEKRVQSLWAFAVSNDNMYNVLAFIIEKFPVYMLKLQAMVTQNEKLKSMSDLGMNIYAKLDEMMYTYSFFINGRWRFKSNKVLGLVERLPPHQQLEFGYGVK